LPGLIAERVFTLFDRNKDQYAGRDEFIAAICRLLSKSFDDKIKIVFEIYDFDNDGIVPREDMRVILSSVPLAEILAGKKSQRRREGIFTRTGGG